MSVRIWTIVTMVCDEQHRYLSIERDGLKHRHPRVGGHKDAIRCVIDSDGILQRFRRV
jgi:hypothetical protein